ncbi:MAG: hypothetical protein ACREJO_04460 [Phycisphaerales bacterium]
MWSAANILSLCREALQQEEVRRIAEQAVYGLEALDEVDLHPILAACLTAAGFGVLREQLYPAEWRRKKGRRKDLPEDSERQRCDLVLTPRLGQALADPLEHQRSAERDRAALRGTLFEQLTDAARTAPAAQNDSAIDPAECFWLEVKLVAQFAYAAGVPGPNRTYTSQLIRGISSDLRKLRDDPAITHGAALLVLLTVDRAVAEADIPTLVHRLVDHGTELRAPIIDGFRVPDRIGNGWCSLALLQPVGPVQPHTGAAR